jgi:hypothetical protein
MTGRGENDRVRQVSPVRASGQVIDIVKEGFARRLQRFQGRLLNEEHRLTISNKAFERCGCRAAREGCLMGAVRVRSAEYRSSE